ncbi:MAG TPA: flagellar basal body-associated FliL family protein [Deltaproteobacteria bacterium]|jgi:flagellar FliL protein|nr:flagellar basal body-associated FliL family protein [Deltaproteobacteria bacterium]HOI07487.1 flagellar basal body-associated FliL family protein [Deltaproteobacteria bacterium]
MVDEKVDEKDAGAEKKPKGKKTLVLIIAAVVVAVLVGGVAAGYFFLIAPKGKQAGEGGQENAGSYGKESGKHREAAIRALEPFVVNLTDADTRYLKVVIQLEMSSEELIPELDKKMPQIRDEIIMLLSSKSFDDLSTPPGKRSLKRALIEGVNRNLTTGAVVNVFFSDFVIQ